MEEQDYEYRDLLATTWDLFRGDTSQWPDRFFFRDSVNMLGEPVLDVGCGTGRLLLDFMLDGIDIDGVDNSPEMLAQCRDKADKLGLQPNLYLQEMQEMNLPRKYRVIMVPSSSFQLVTNPRAARRTMACFYDHLLAGGFLVMPFILIWQDGDPLQTDWVQDGEIERPADGVWIHRWSRARYDLKNQLEHTETRYEVFRDGQLITSEYHVRSPATRWYSQAQALDLYRAAGFVELQVFSEFSRKPAKADDQTYSVIGMKE